MNRRAGAAVSRWLFAACLCVAVAAAAEDLRMPESATNAPASPSSWPTITSHQRNFLIADMPKRDAVEIAIWAESVRERFIGWIGAPLPYGRAYPVVIIAALRPAEPAGRVLRALDLAADGSLRQEVTMVNPAAMDQEDVLEALCWLMANRWVVARLADRSAEVPVLPDWLTTGIAQNIYPDLRVRNYRDVLALEQAGGYQPAATVFDLRFLPPGRWPEKARSGLVVAWLAEVVGPEALLVACADRMVEGRPVDAAFVRDLLGLPDVRAVNMAWDVWMARQARRLTPGVMTADAAAIAEILALPAETFGLELPASFGARTLDAGLLITHRDAAWVHRYAKTVAWRLREASIGQPPELVERIKAFLVFFDALAAPGETGKKGKPGKPRPARWLTKTWNDADAGWRAYLEDLERRTALLERHEAAEGGSVGSLLDRWEQAPAAP
jgi:hypothetical protein